MLGVPDVFKELYRTDKTIVLLTGGRGGLKSFNSSLFVTRVTYEKKHVIMYCRYTMDSAEDSVIPEVKEKLELDGTVNDFKVTKRDIVNKKSGSKILFRGIKTSSGNQTAKLKGTKNISMFICDEAEEWRSEADFDTMMGSVRSKLAQNMIIIIMNPCDVDHFIYQRYFKDNQTYREIDGVPIQMCTHKDVLHIHTTYLDGLEYLSDNFKEWANNLREEHLKLPKERQLISRYSRLVLGRWADRKEGVVFENWSIGEFPERIDYCYGLDFGWYPDPLAMVKVGVDRREKKIYIKQELYANKLSDEMIIQHFKANISRNDLIVCDTNDGKTADRIMSEGFNIYKAVKEKIKDDIGDMAEYEIIVDPNSEKVIYELNNYTWNDKKASIPNDNNNHAMDAMRYGFRRLMSPTISASWG